jgi:D-galactose 1-dehydrogenase
MGPIRLGIVGVGKIARDHHIPSVVGNPSYQFTAVSSRNSQTPGVRNFHSIGEMLAQLPDLDAVSICTPPQLHYEAARLALTSGRHVLLEKPPCTSLTQLRHLESLATVHAVTLYQTWHSQHAHGVAPAAQLLRQHELKNIRVTWKEDVRMWHPGQTWIWQAGGFGVFDIGFNPLSILTRLIEEPIFASAATLYVPANCETPIAATANLDTPSGVEILLELDFRHTGTQTWDIDMETDGGALKLAAGGGRLMRDNVPVPIDESNLASEYRSIYRRFAELVAQKRSEVDASPMQLVADIFLIANRIAVEPFLDSARAT